MFMTNVEITWVYHLGKRTNLV